ncbi:MAG: two-component sensor histidine kinase [Alteromonadaceae bacterium]|nr:two-component sensor histidine kinase [Alteromonadaceae bacterium]
MKEDYEALLEKFNLLNRLKKQAEQAEQQQTQLLQGIREVLEANTTDELYTSMFEMFRAILPYQESFVLEHKEANSLRCTLATQNALIGSIWQMNPLFEKVLAGKASAVINKRLMKIDTSVLDSLESNVSALLLCPLTVRNNNEIIVFGHPEAGFYTQESVATFSHFQAYTDQALLSVQAKLMAMESAQLREAKENAERSLLRSEKMAAIGLLASGVAHEINNPVGFVKANMDFVQNEWPVLQKLVELTKSLSESSSATKEPLEALISYYQDSEIDWMMEEFTSVFKESADGLSRVENIVKSLKSFVHEDGSIELNEFDVVESINDVLILVKPEIKLKAELVLNLNPVPKVKGDKRKLGQVIVNLVVNASQAVNENGLITLTTTHDEQNNCVVITVEDNGSGIEEDALDNLFTPFYTTKTVGEGTGLGLYISQSIVEALGGSLQVSSEVGKGTIFTILLQIEGDESL